MNDTIGSARSGVTGLDELDQLADLIVDELLIGHMRLQPEDQLVEEEDQAVIAELFSVSADHRQTVLQRNERVLVTARAADVGGHRSREQGGHQPVASRIAGVGSEGPVQVR